MTYNILDLQFEMFDEAQLYICSQLTEDRFSDLTPVHILVSSRLITKIQSI